MYHAVKLLGRSFNHDSLLNPDDRWFFQLPAYERHVPKAAPQMMWAAIIAAGRPGRSCLGAISQGAIGGGVGTLFMSVFMLACGALGVMGEQPPKKVTRRAFAAIVGNSPSERTSNVLASFAHLAFGMGAGALFGLLPWRGQARPLSALQGILFGVGVWATSYHGWIPMLGILPHPPETNVLLALWMGEAMLDEEGFRQ
jgi:hypothetical protein